MLQNFVQSRLQKPVDADDNWFQRYGANTTHTAIDGCFKRAVPRSSHFTNG